MRKLWRAINDWKVAAAILLLVSPVFAPELLAFPYKTASGGLTVYSEQPLDEAALARVVARSDALIRQSPIARPPEHRRVFLTNGGWRWVWLAAQDHNSFAVTRPGRETMVFNRSDVAGDRIWSNRAIGHQRSLSGTLAHEICHGMTHRSFGIPTVWTKPAWLNEGYCDYVAQESSLSDSQAKTLKASGEPHPALVYYEGRRRVAAELARNGGDIAAIYAAN